MLFLNIIVSFDRAFALILCWYPCQIVQTTHHHFALMVVVIVVIGAFVVIIITACFGWIGKAVGTIVTRSWSPLSCCSSFGSTDLVGIGYIIVDKIHIGGSTSFSTI